MGAIWYGFDDFQVYLLCNKPNQILANKKSRLGEKYFHIQKEPFKR